MKEIKLIRHDLISSCTGSTSTTGTEDIEVENFGSLEKCTELFKDSEEWPNDRESCINQFSLPKDSIIKVYYEGHLIPWSLIEKCASIDIRIYRPNQNGEFPICITEWNWVSSRDT